ncbi:MAG: hypothetical protein JXR91_04235 [Deltaproteobacteria bacterium]|nr:hypothetical protein [Deltaproteobacteria bacterium]
MNQNRFEKIIEIENLKKLEGDLAQIEVNTSQPPGARIGFTAFGVEFHAKVVDLKKGETGGYLITAKVNSLSRSDRQTVEENI